MISLGGFFAIILVNNLQVTIVAQIVEISTRI